MKRCLLDQKQNANELLYSVIWLIYPNNKFANFNIINSTACKAIMRFNMGEKRSINLQNKYMDIVFSKVEEKSAKKRDKNRIYNSIIGYGGKITRK